jgi:hypothetical protein
MTIFSSRTIYGIAPCYCRKQFYFTGKIEEIQDWKGFDEGSFEK